MTGERLRRREVEAEEGLYEGCPCDCALGVYWDEGCPCWCHDLAALDNGYLEEWGPESG